MPKKPNLEAIIEKLQSNGNFKLTADEYLKLTGADMPKDKTYTEKRSAVALKAQEYGYKIEMVTAEIKFIKK